MKIEGKVAIVTGGASGLGRATAGALIANGAKVAIWDMNEELGNEVVAQLGENAMFTKINVADEAAVAAAVQAVVERFGAIHILANIAGIAPGLFETPIYKKQETIDALMKDCVFPVRFGKPHEFASLLLEIVRNSMINGTTIRLDGAVRF